MVGHDRHDRQFDRQEIACGERQQRPHTSPWAGPINDARKTALLEIAEGVGFASQHVAFVTAYLDRASQTFRKTVSGIASGSYAWFASEPDKLVLFSGKLQQIEGG